MPRRKIAAAVAAFILAALPAATAELVMVEEEGCPWCRRWNEEIGGIYAKTEEGQAAPLRRIDIEKPVPPDLTLDMPASYTPTFILVEDGREIGRIEGYPGEDFFWPMLGALLERLPEE